MQTTFADWGVAYKVAVCDVALGILAVVLSPVFGGAFYRVFTALLDALGAPENRSLFDVRVTGAGTELLLLFGSYLIAVGVCIFCVRFVLELLGLAGQTNLTRRMMPPGKLVWGTVAAAVVVLAASILPNILISLFFDGYESAALAGVESGLGAISQAGRLLVMCAVITLFFAPGHRFSYLFRWTGVAGWGKIRWGWINKLALAMIAGGIISLAPFFGSPWMPFDDVASIFLNAGIIVLVLGIVPQFFSRGRP